MSMNHALLGLSPNIPPGPKEGDLAHDMSHEAKRMHNEKGEMVLFKRDLIEWCRPHDAQYGVKDFPIQK